jgi:SAM-dependent methyltransferase
MSDDASWMNVEQEHAPAGIDVTKPSIARVYDAILRGKDNFAVDRAVAEHAHRAFPDGGEAAFIKRRMLGRAVRYLANEDVDQFLDLGSGLPTVQNTHQIAQAVSPRARVVYVDNDPIVLAHGRALLAENENTTVVTADLREPDLVLAHPEITSFLDLTRPVGLIMNAVIHHVLDEEDPQGIIDAYKQRIAPGSYLLLTHFSSSSPEARELEAVLLRTLGRGQLRTREQIAGFFDGLEIVEPGIVYLPLWRPDRPVSDKLDMSGLLYIGGVGRKLAG